MVILNATIYNSCAPKNLLSQSQIHQMWMHESQYSSNISITWPTQPNTPQTTINRQYTPIKRDEESKESIWNY